MGHMGKLAATALCGNSGPDPQPMPDLGTNLLNRLLDLMRSCADEPSPETVDDTQAMDLEDQAMDQRDVPTPVTKPLTVGGALESRLAAGQEAVDWFRQQIEAVSEQIEAVSHELVSRGNGTDVMRNPDHSPAVVLVRAHQHEIQAQSVTLSRKQLHTVQTYRATRGTKPSTWHLRQPKVWAARDHERLTPAVAPVLAPQLCTPASSQPSASSKLPPKGTPAVHT
eukprot:TRINITY_DN2695_c0_g1_i1.p1 TRINITY_DN2695_c0_g1~~TRINITY_DN2695_c0_g1_i1.p1  ORF type:complete len:225 (-),score=27.86 TRINITY_DN2695_c0_g1_i1:471-1145(-)